LIFGVAGSHDTEPMPASLAGNSGWEIASPKTVPSLPAPTLGQMAAQPETANSTNPVTSLEPQPSLFKRVGIQVERVTFNAGSN
jgi:hypothetical protein